MRDGVIKRLIGKWLNAGVMDKGCLTHPEAGTPQGGVVSPMLSNIYLHEVLDMWFERDVKPRLNGRAFLVRYADDFIMGFELEEDARRVQAVLPKRFEKYGLALHPDKTRLVPFGKPRGPKGPPDRRSGHFDFLGFTHFWGTSPRQHTCCRGSFVKNGRWVVKRKTAKNRFSRAIQRIGEWMSRNRHKPLGEQQRTLWKKLQGHFHYYGITGNSKALGSFHFEVRKLWRKWLDRRSQRAKVTWDKMNRILTRFPLPKPIAHRSILKHAANP